MIVAPEWLWLHMPKCAGSETEQILRKCFLQDDRVRFDPVGPGYPIIWHHTLKKRSEFDPDFSVNGRRVFCNIRRLPSWILSRIHFEVQRSGHRAIVTREELLAGMFRNPPEPSGATGKLIKADEILRRFKEGVTDWIRTENLEADLHDSFGISVRSERAGSNQNRFQYIRAIKFWFTPLELEGLYKDNPVWRDLEIKVYGDVIQ